MPPDVHPADPAPDPPPVRLTAPRIRWPWVVSGLFALLVVAAIVFSSRPERSDPPIGAGFVAFGVAVSALAIWLRNRARLELVGSSVTLRPPAGRTRSFDLRDVERIRRRRNKGGAHYAIRLRPGTGSRWRRVSIPIDLFGGKEADDELLRRLAAVPGIDADRRTAAALEVRRS